MILFLIKHTNFYFLLNFGLFLEIIYVIIRLPIRINHPVADFLHHYWSLGTFSYWSLNLERRDAKIFSREKLAAAFSGWSGNIFFGCWRWVFVRIFEGNFSENFEMLITKVDLVVWIRSSKKTYSTVLYTWNHGFSIK